MSYEVYKFLHLAGIALTLLSLGSLSQQPSEGRKKFAWGHGLGLLMAFVAGFGMLARLGISAKTGWVLLKLALFIIMGGSIALFKRKPELASKVWWGVWGVFLIGAYIGVFHRTLFGI